MSEEKWVQYECSICGTRMVEKPNISRICGVLSDKKSCRGKFYPIGIFEPHVPKRVLDFLKNPRLFELLVEEAGKGCVGEIQNKENAILIIHGGRLVSNGEATSSNLFIEGTSGGGKDAVGYSAIINLLGKGLVHHVKRITPRVLDYYHQVDEEPYFDWNTYVLYLEDISQSILNAETLRVMCSGGNSALVVRDGRAVEMRIKGKPALYSTSAQSYLDEDMRRRWASSSIDPSDEHSKAIKKFKIKIAKDGLPMYNKDLVNSSYCLKRVEVSIPFADQILEGFPDSVLARTGVSRLLDFIRFSTALYQYQREQNERGELIATIQDYEIARRVFMNLYAERKTLEPLSSNHKAILQYLEGVKTQCSASDVHDKVGKNCFNQFTGTWKALNSLVRKRLINSTQEGVVTYYQYIQQRGFSLIEPDNLKGSIGNEGSKGNKGSLGNELKQLPTFPQLPIKFEYEEIKDDED